MAQACALSTTAARPAFATRQVATRASRSSLVVRAAAAASGPRKLWAPNVVAPDYLNGSLAGDYGWDPLGLGADPKALQWYRQSELQHARWAMLGCLGVLVQEIVKPDVFFYEAGLPKNLPNIEFGGKVNYGGILAWEFLLMHWVEVRRWQDYKNFGSVNEDPIFKNNKLSNPEMGYPGFDPFNFAKGNFEDLKVKEIKNGRLAMVSFMGFIVAAQATGKNPIAALQSHLANPFGNNIATNIGTCVIPSSVNVQGVDIPLICLWPGQH